MGKRTWVKLYCDNWITGTLREETAAVRGVWADLLALVGSNPNSDTGELKLTNNVGWSDNQICEVLSIPIDIWKTAKQRLTQTDRITVTPNNVITILNWSKYQEDYSRQTIYRKKKKENPSTLKKENRL